MKDIKVVLKAGTPVSVEDSGGKLTPPFPLDRDREATVFAMNGEWHVYLVNRLLHYVQADQDR